MVAVRTQFLPNFGKVARVRRAARSGPNRDVAAFVSERQDIRIGGAQMTGADDSDYWTNLTGWAEQGERGEALSASSFDHVLEEAHRGTRDAVMPVDGLNGVLSHLMGSPRSAGPSGNTHFNHYALVDAAKLDGLCEQIEASGLESRCLFKGAAEAELCTAAPWLIELDSKNSFARSLFDVGEERWQMWHDEVAVFIRSHLSVDDLRNHLRRFLRLRDRSGRWYFFRFYSPETLRTIVRSSSRIRKALLGDRIQSISCRGLDGEVVTLVGDAPGADISKREAAPMVEDIRETAPQTAFRAERETIEVRRVAAFLRREYGPGVACLDVENLVMLAGRIRSNAAKFGFASREAVLRYAMVVMAWGCDFQVDPQRAADLAEIGWDRGDERPRVHAASLGRLLECVRRSQEATFDDTSDLFATSRRLRTIWTEPIEGLTARSVADRLARLWPAHACYMGPEALNRFAQRSLEVSDVLHLRDADALGYAALAIPFGIHFAWDPLYPWAQDAYLSEVLDPDVRREKLGTGIMSYLKGLGVQV